MVWVAASPLDHCRNAQGPPAESVCCSGAVTVWVSPGPQEENRGDAPSTPSTVRLKPVGSVRKTAATACTNWATMEIADGPGGTWYVWLLAPPSLHERKTHWRPCWSNCGETGARLCAVSTPQSRVTGAETSARSARS